MKNYDLSKFEVIDRGANHGGRYEIRVNRLFAITDNEVMVLETLFSDKPDRPFGFHGATGYTMRVTPQSEIDSRLNEPDVEMWKMAVENGETTDSLEDWWHDTCENADYEGLLFPYDDPSFREDFEYLLQNADESDTEAIKENILDPLEDDGEKLRAWSCGSCGRCIVTEASKVAYWFDKDLLNLAKWFEKE